MNNKICNHINICHFILLAVILSACHHPSIILNKVTNLPHEFYAAKHFGKDLSSVYKKNEFLLVTGMVERDERPPLKQAVFAIGNTNIFLPLRSSTDKNGEKTETYSGTDYSLTLLIKKELTIYYMIPCTMPV